MQLLCRAHYSDNDLLLFFSFSKVDKVFREKDLTPKGPVLHPIIHKEFNEFIKGKGFKGRNNYKLKDLKAMFGFKPMITGSPVTISSNGMGPTRFDSLSKASSTGIPYITHGSPYICDS